ncbi:hypothetical protein [Mycobacterium pseudokansasii]|uniref:hypothetical protein n=1 Tax=Mycobacterium pseudokansasii TaxID=2341080 RepID=UPI001C3FDBC1|nr:hypothetical protein [Mycobacterium pseudokansasii]
MGSRPVDVPLSIVLGHAKVFVEGPVTIDSAPDTAGLADAVGASVPGVSTAMSTEKGAAGCDGPVDEILVCAPVAAGADPAKSRGEFISLPRPLIAPDPVGPGLRAVPPPRLRLAVNSSRHIPLP